MEQLKKYTTKKNKMQTMHAVINEKPYQLYLPPEDEEILPNIKWGAFDELYSPAFWLGQAWQHNKLGTYKNLRLGRTLQEEVAACLLGGYGMPAELALAAYNKIRSTNMLQSNPSAKDIEAVLSEPLLVNGHPRHYRFAKQKAAYLSGCLNKLSTFNVPDNDVVFRNKLTTLPGIGLKTASWIVRNLRGADNIAILDIHILRAGRHINLFEAKQTPEKNYLELEERFVQLANAMDLSAGMLDGLIWDYMRLLSRSVANNNKRNNNRQMQLFEDSARQKETGG